MNCLNETEIQKYLDKEFPEQLLLEIADHLSTCTICKERFVEARETKNQIFSFLDEVRALEQTIEVPEFRPIKQNKSRKLIISVVSVAATVLILIGMGIHLKSQNLKQKQSENTDKATYEITRKADPNKMFHDKQIIVVETNASGEVVETSFTE
jgi:hypothetical protein